MIGGISLAGGEDILKTQDAFRTASGIIAETEQDRRYFRGKHAADD